MLRKAKDKGQIKVSVSAKSFDKPIEPPENQKKDTRERKKDIGDMPFSTKKVDKASADRILSYYENEKAKNVRLENEKIDLFHMIDYLKDREKEMYLKIYPFWELSYYSDPAKASMIANEFSVNPEHSEHRKNIQDLRSVLEAYLKITHFAEPEKEGFRKLFTMEKEKRETAEGKASSLEDENRKLKEEIQRIKSQKITVGSSSLIPVIQENHEEMEFPMMEMEIPDPEFMRYEVDKESLNEKSLEPELEKFEVEDSVFMSVLKEKGYKVYHSKNPHHDAVVEQKEEEIPLCYIDYPIENVEVFDQIMESTDKIYFLFDSNEHFDKGNGKFTRWLVFSGRKQDIRYSLTKIDELKKKGMLNTL